jgi:hypothetical protein
MAEAPDAERLSETRNDRGKGDGEEKDIKDQEGGSPDLMSSHGSKTEKVKTGEEAGKEAEKPKPSKLKAMIGKLGLDVGTVLMMFK